MNRKTFICQTGLTAASLVLSKPLSAFVGSPANRVRIAVMGVNSRGHFLATMFSKLPDVEVAFLCDPDRNALNKTTEAVEKISGKKPEGFEDLRKLLERKDLDALVIAAPDHWHAPAAIMALQAGKHVYVEKPCSHNP